MSVKRVLPYFLFLNIVFLLPSCVHRIIIDSNPPDAEVHISNEFRGTTPLTLRSDEAVNQDILLNRNDRELYISGLPERYWGFAYTFMLKTYFRGLIAGHKDEKERKLIEEILFGIIWTVPSIVIGLPSIVTPDIFVFEMNLPENIKGYNLSKVNYGFMEEIIKEYDIKDLVTYKKEYFEKLKVMNAPYYYKGISVYNNEGISLLRIIDIRKNATGLLLGAYRFNNRADGFSFTMEINYSRVISKYFSIMGSSGFTEEDGFLSWFNLGGVYNYSLWHWFGVTPGVGAGLFIHDEPGVPIKNVLLPVLSLEIDISPNSFIATTFTFLAKANGFGFLWKNKSTIEGTELLGGFRIMF